jgi:hypothetical protein
MSEPLGARSRRVLLRGGLGGLVAIVAGAYGRPQPVRAEGETMHVGGDYLTATTATQLKNTTTNNDVVILQTTQGGRALYAKATDNHAVEGWTADPSSAGIHGITAAPNGIGVGVLGSNDGKSTSGSLAGPGAGVFGIGPVGVWGSSMDGIAVKGLSGNHGVGLYGNSYHGIAVHAETEDQSDGMALFVDGRARFTRSGVATIPAGSDRIDVSVPYLFATSLVLATLQQFRSGIHIASATPKPETSTVTIRLNGTVTMATKVAWQVLDTA